MPTCPVCNSITPALKYKLKFDVYHCKECELHFCPEAKFINSLTSDLNEEFREKALKFHRKQNFKKVISLLKMYLSADKQNGLEVGCGHGWFIETCTDNGLKCEGIEPEIRFNESYKSKGLKVINGFYPDDISKESKYGFIVFNDVIEHIPNIERITRYNNSHLHDKGILIINLPVQEGLVYHISIIAYHFGIKSLLNRMWQFNFHSPHLYYFTKKNLISFVTNHQFKLLKVSKLKTINISDISNRIKQDKDIGTFRYTISLIGIFIIYPFLQLFPDTLCFVFRKEEDI